MAEFVVSTTLLLTPNDAACNCLANELVCQFSPQCANHFAAVETLLGTACSLLVGSGGNHNDISSNSTMGVYGSPSGCSPSTSLYKYIIVCINICSAIHMSYVMSQYHEDQNKAPTACNS